MSLRVPFAMDSMGREVTPESHLGGGDIVCPSCRGRVVHCAGEKVRRYFRHFEPPTYCEFENETEEHLRAKWAIVAAINARREITLERECHDCGSDVAQSLPTASARAVAEHVLKTGHRADVALLGPDDVLLAVIEVLATHPVDSAKAEALQPIPWGEFTAAEVLAGTDDSRCAWPVLRDHFRPTRCQRCREFKRFGQVVKFIPPSRALVACPAAAGAPVEPVVTCSGCEHFVGVERAGVQCVGSKVHAAR